LADHVFAHVVGFFILHLTKSATLRILKPREKRKIAMIDFETAVAFTYDEETGIVRGRLGVSDIAHVDKTEWTYDNLALAEKMIRKRMARGIYGDVLTLSKTLFEVFMEVRGLLSVLNESGLLANVDKADEQLKKNSRGILMPIERTLEDVAEQQAKEIERLAALVERQRNAISNLRTMLSRYDLIAMVFVQKRNPRIFLALSAIHDFVTVYFKHNPLKPHEQTTSEVNYVGGHSDPEL
jgi:hypothetical protein